MKKKKLNIKSFQIESFVVAALNENQQRTINGAVDLKFTDGKPANFSGGMCTTAWIACNH